MADGARFVHIVDDVPELSGEEPVLVLVMHGFLDAGNAAGLAADHLEDLGGGKVVATFAVDEFYDYRARRPPMSFMRDHYEQYDAPRMTVRLMRDQQMAPYLFLRGPEPDNRWEGFTAAVHEVVRRLRVSSVLSLASVPMAVPHTRPIAITPHANDSSLIDGGSRWKGELRIPSSAQSLLEVRLGEWGHPALGFVAHVPHYISQMDYPRAAIALLEETERATGLSLDPSALQAGAEQTDGRDRRLPGHQQPRSARSCRDWSSSTTRSSRPRSPGRRCWPTTRTIPTGEEIGAQFERFLAGLDSPDPSDDD